MIAACFPANRWLPVQPIVTVLIAWFCPLSRPLDLSSVLDCGDFGLALIAKILLIISHSRRCATKRAGARHRTVPANLDSRSLTLTPSRIRTSDTFSPVLASPFLRLRLVSCSVLELALVSVIVRWCRFQGQVSLLV